MKQDYEQRLRDINKEAEAILSEARKKAMDNEAAIIAQAKEEAARRSAVVLAVSVLLGVIIAVLDRVLLLLTDVIISL